VIGVFALSLLAACGSTTETPRQDEPRRDEARRDEPRREEGRRKESRPDHERGRPHENRKTFDTSHTTSLGLPHDLGADEARGGHTLSRHVGRSDGDLQERLNRERNISAASTYTDRATAEAVVGKVIDHNPRIDRWAERAGRRPNLALDYHGNASQPIGRCMQRGSTVAIPAWDAIVVLKAASDGDFYVLTTYPECPR
jgi:hypothetical protein